MKTLLALLIISPLLGTAQKSLPRLENDTLYTSSGYKIYEGQVLQLATGTGLNGNFRFLKYDKGPHLESARLKNTTILVKKVYDYKVTDLGNYYIGIKGVITFSDKSKSKIVIDMNFDRAISNFGGLPPEITVPEEFRNKQITGKANVTSEIERLFNLYKEGALTKEEYETQKAILLKQQ